jgi:hypothetical protein
MNLDEALRALYVEYHVYVRAKRDGASVDERRFAYVNHWINALEAAEAYLHGELWTKYTAP